MHGEWTNLYLEIHKAKQPADSLPEANSRDAPAALPAPKAPFPPAREEAPPRAPEANSNPEWRSRRARWRRPGPRADEGRKGAPLCLRPSRAFAGTFLRYLQETAMQQMPCKFACLFRFTKARGITFQQLNFLKRMYIAQNNKMLRQQAKLKAESAASPFHERELLASEKMVIHDVSPLLPPSSEKPVKNGLELTAVTGDLATVAETSSKKEKQWKEMKLNMNELPGILARLSKIKLTGIIAVFNLIWSMFHSLIGLFYL
ncbi:UNVERIFIED_CONTAM: hypothetical protein K2H54_006217 [Gekko kuhli]